MTAPLFRHSSAPAAASLRCDPAPEAVCLEDADLFTPAQIEFLAARGLVFLTSRPLADSGRSRTAIIVAGNYHQAVRIADRRGQGEKVMGLMGHGFLRNLKMRLLERQ